MEEPSLLGFLAGPFTFLRPDRGELDRLFGNGLRALPWPQRIFLEDEEATPLEGFPVLAGEGAKALADATEEFVRAEEEAQLATFLRQRFERDRHTEAWQRYHRLLRRAVENATLSSYGRRYPSIFWLSHSIEVARLLRQTPRRLLRLNLEVGKEEGKRIKYRVFDKFLDRARAVSQETLRTLESDASEVDEELYPTLLRQMAENVLIFTEEHVSFDLRELAVYLDGFLGVDASDFLRRLDLLREWHQACSERDPALAALNNEVLHLQPESPPYSALFRRGYLRYLSAREDYDEKALLSSDAVDTWETLLDQLKRFEVLSALRDRVISTRAEGGRLIFRAGPSEPAVLGKRQINFSMATRPLDFSSAWVIDPVVHRYGIIYDVTDYSRVISLLRRTGRDAQEHGFRLMFRFQRQVNSLARQYKLNLEKFLGDGAFFTSRHPLRLMACAVHLQRTYRSFLRQGLPFDRGLRIGLNSSHYRLMPIHTPGESDVHRYEFFGHGVVELSRLTSGKMEEELEDVQTLMLSRGYPAETVHRFFAPLIGADEPSEPRATSGERRFTVTLTRNGALINEGIVATANLINELERVLGDRLLYETTVGGKPYVAIPVDDSDRLLLIGIRKLGVARFKGLDDITVYEIVDGDQLGVGDLRPMPQRLLSAATDELATAPLDREGKDKLH